MKLKRSDLSLPFLCSKKEVFDYFNFCGPDLLSRMEIAKMYKKNLFHDLILDHKDPPDGFWRSRAKEINMGSKYFKILLSREPQKIETLIKKL